MAKVRFPWYRKKLARPAFAAAPIPLEQLPASLNTRIWRPSDPDWEDRPKDPRCEHAATPFKPPQGLGFDPIPDPLTISEVE